MSNIEKRILRFEIYWFLIIQILGIFVGYNLRKSFLARGETLPVIQPSQFSIPIFLIVFFGVTLFFFLISRFSPQKSLIFKLIFLLISFMGGGIVLESFFSSYLALSIMIGLILLWLLLSSVWIHNLLLGLGIAGVASLVGLSLQPQMIIILFIILSIYDIISVYKTKHMVKMAKSMIESRAVLGLIIPQKVAGFLDKLKEVKMGDPKHNFFVLGSGDVIFPLLLAISVLPQGINKSLILVLFSVVGIAFSFWLFLKLGKKPMPALPPIALFSLFGYLIAKFI